MDVRIHSYGDVAVPKGYRMPRGHEHRDARRTTLTPAVVYSTTGRLRSIGLPGASARIARWSFFGSFSASSRGDPLRVGSNQIPPIHEGPNWRQFVITVVVVGSAVTIVSTLTVQGTLA
jgi:hypothetical protein